MDIFGYQIGYNRLSPKNLRDWENEGYACAYFGVGSWTFNNPVFERLEVRKFREKRKIIAREKGLYIHIWLFGYRHDVDFRKTVRV